MKSFLYKIPPEVSGDAHEMICKMISLKEALQLCPRDREEYWVQRLADERILYGEFNEKVVRKYHNPKDFDMNNDNIVVMPNIHWMTNLLEIIIEEKGEKTT